MENQASKKNWKVRLGDELKEYLVNAVYLSVYFSVFIMYRRLILEGYDVSFQEYGIGVIKALILAKVIMIGSLFHIGKKFQNSPVIVTTIYQAVVFTIWVIVFKAVEVLIGALIHSPSFSGIADKFRHEFNVIWLGGVVVVFFTFIPFFALKELDRKMGEGYVRRLLFKRNTPVP